MNKEIKEILDRLERIDHKEYSCGFEFADSATFDEMARCFEERKKMADCITNLQEDVYEYEKLLDIQDKREYHKRYLEERRKEEPNLLYPDYDEIYKRYYEQKELINTVIDDLKHFHLIYNEDGKLILSGESILTEIRYFIDKLEGTIPTTMTPFEHDMWERENRIKGEENENN